MLGGCMSSGHGASHTPEVESFARTFAPDRNRRAQKHYDLTWLGGGLGLVVAAGLILVVAALASQRALPATGLLAMKASPGMSVEQLRTLNEDAAPWTALSSFPLLVSGLWLLVRRPDRKTARRIGAVGGALFAAALVIASAFTEGCVGIGGSC